MTYSIATPMVRRRAQAAGAVWLAMLAVVLRLVLPTAPLPATDLDLAASFGEHALCLAGASTSDDASGSRTGGSPAQPDEHGGHDGLNCCLWHAVAVGFVLPETVSVTRAAYDIRIVPFVAVTKAGPGRITGPAQARAPPPEA